MISKKYFSGNGAKMGYLADFCPFLRFSAMFGPQYLLKLDFDRLDFLETNKGVLEL